MAALGQHWLLSDLCSQAVQAVRQWAHNLQLHQRYTRGAARMHAHRPWTTAVLHFVISLCCCLRPHRDGRTVPGCDPWPSQLRSESCQRRPLRRSLLKIRQLAGHLSPERPLAEPPAPRHGPVPRSRPGCHRQCLTRAHCSHWCMRLHTWRLGKPQATVHRMVQRNDHVCSCHRTVQSRTQVTWG